VHIAATLPTATGDALLDSARNAFVQGMNLAAVLAGLLLIGASVLVWALLRGTRAAGERPADLPADASPSELRKAA
jgi:DHA2 family multidrug resistance protein-like MFS transporter